MAAILDAEPCVDSMAQQAAFAVYRNTAIGGCIDALHANYPAVTKLVGEDWLRAAAAVFVRQHPPRDGRLLLYGDRLPDFLRAFEPVAHLPWLPEVAQLDRFWIECHTAADAQAVSLQQLAQFPAYGWDAVCLRPHPAARWWWSAHWPVYTLWASNRDDQDFFQPVDSMDWQPQGALLTRPDAAVQSCACTRAGCALLDACAQNLPLLEACQAACNTDPTVDLPALLQQLAGQGALVLCTASSKT